MQDLDKMTSTFNSVMRSSSKPKRGSSLHSGTHSAIKSEKKSK
jgi:hypothetical protein